MWLSINYVVLPASDNVAVVFHAVVPNENRDADTSHAQASYVSAHQGAGRTELSEESNHLTHDGISYCRKGLRFRLTAAENPQRYPQHLQSY